MPTTDPTVPPPSRSVLLRAIATGGCLAGALDGASAFWGFGWNMPYGIASGILGSKAFPAAGGGGSGIWLLGLGLHFVIALGAAAIYCAASRRLTFLTRHLVTGAVFCGISVYLVMNLLVLPLSAVPFPIGPFSVAGLRYGLTIHVLLVGLPIAASLWFFARRARP